MPDPVAPQGICLAFGDGVHDQGQTWEDIDDYVISFSIQRGRPSEFDTIEGGTASLRLQDRKGYFDPSNPYSPYSTLLQPLVQAAINVQHPIRGTWHDVFRGYVETYNYSRIGPRGAITVIPLCDGFEVLNQAHVLPPTTGRSGTFFDIQHVDARILAALADAGWPGAKHRIATGNVNVQAINYDVGTPFLEIIQDAAEAEFPHVATFFMDKSGNATFTGRGVRFDPDSYPQFVHFPHWQVGDAESCRQNPQLLPIAAMGEIQWGKDHIFNDALVAPRNFTTPDIASLHVTDDFSIGRFGIRSISLLDLLILEGTGPTGAERTAIEECGIISNYFVNNYAYPNSRLSGIEFHGAMDDGTTRPAEESGRLWDFILGVELGDIVQVYTNHPGPPTAPGLANQAGGILGDEYFVEGISHDVTRLNGIIHRWVMNLDLSPKAVFASYP